MHLWQLHLNANYQLILEHPLEIFIILLDNHEFLRAL